MMNDIFPIHTVEQYEFFKFALWNQPLLPQQHMVHNNSPTSTSTIMYPDKLDMMKGENLTTPDNIASLLVSSTS